MHLAQVNIALPLAPLDAPLLAEFMAALAPVNAAADGAPGFVWRLQGDGGDATGVRGFGDDRIVVNMTVWETLEALRAFVYADPDHLAVMRRRREWFARLRRAYSVAWWVPTGVRPTVAQAEEPTGRPAPGRPDALRVHLAASVPATGRLRRPATDDDWFCPA